MCVRSCSDTTKRRMRCILRCMCRSARRWRESACCFEDLSGEPCPPVDVSVICFANATVSLRLGHGAGLTAHRAVIQHRAAASLPCTGEASRCGGDFSPSHGSRRASPLLVEGAFAGGQGRTPLQGLLFQIAVQGLGPFAGKERNQVFNLPPAHEISVQHHTLSLWIAKLFDLHVETPPAVISEFSGRSRSGRRRGPMLWCGASSFGRTVCSVS